MELHLDLLDNKRKEIFNKLANFNREGVLGGGTALSLAIGHRVSYDFDVFLKKDISWSLVLKIKKVFLMKSVLVNTADEFTFLTKENIKVSFIYYPFKLSSVLISRAKAPIKMLSVRGVAVSKAYVLGRRGKWRDYVDLFFILKYEKVTILEIVKLAKETYGELFNGKIFMSQLLYTDDISTEDIKGTKLSGKKEVGLREIKSFFLREVKKYLSNL